MPLWLFTEARNATYLINFAYPALEPGAARLQVLDWSAQEVESRGAAALCAELVAHAAVIQPAAAIFSRYVQPHAAALMTQCRALGVPVLLHLDDLLDAVPADLGDRYVAAYGPDHGAALHACMAACDGMLASTAALAAALAPRQGAKPLAVLQGVCWIPQALDPRRRIKHRLVRLHRRMQTRRGMTIGYMGSSSHQRDLQTIAPALHQLLRDRPTLRFETLGLPPPAALQAAFGSRVRGHGYTRDYPAFLGALYELGWDLGLAPLVPDAFNAAKTHTKFVEYTSCGIPTLAQDMAPYAGLPANAISLSSTAGWAVAAAALLDDAPRRRLQLQAAVTVCSSRYRPASAAAQLHAAVQACTGRRGQ